MLDLRRLAPLALLLILAACDSSPASPSAGSPSPLTGTATEVRFSGDFNGLSVVKGQAGAPRCKLPGTGAYSGVFIASVGSHSYRIQIDIPAFDVGLHHYPVRSGNDVIQKAYQSPPVPEAIILIQLSTANPLAGDITKPPPPGGPTWGSTGGSMTFDTTQPSGTITADLVSLDAKSRPSGGHLHMDGPWGC